MQFAFTEDQLTISQAARDMLVETCTPAELRKQLEAGKPRDDARWSTISEMGLIGMLAPENAGGLGMTMVDLIGIAEAAGYVGLPEPLVEQAGVVVPLLARLDDNRGWLGKVLAGAVVAIGHPINPFVANADSADALLLADGDDIHLVAPGDVTLTRAESFDPFRRLFSVQWTPSASTKVGSDWGDTADRGALLAAAEMIGLAQRSIDLAVAYAKDRVQFGKPIAQFQAVRHRLAETLVAIEGAEATLSLPGVDNPDLTALLAKAAAGKAALLAAKNCQQVLAGIGFTAEHGLHVHVERALVLDGLLGSSRELTKKAGAGLRARGSVPRLAQL